MVDTEKQSKTATYKGSEGAQKQGRPIEDYCSGPGGKIMTS